MQLTCHSVQQTLALGQLLGQLAPPPPHITCIALDGPLGAGKTHLTRGIALGAKISDPSLVSSPTYVLLNIYPGPKPLYHLDAYRIQSEEDFQAVGLEELLSPPLPENTNTPNGSNPDSGGIIVIEWSSKIPHLLPKDHLHISLQHADHPTHPETTRLINLTPTGPTAQTLVNKIMAALPAETI